LKELLAYGSSEVTKSQICFVTAAEITVKAFLVNHLKTLSTQYEISVVTNTNNLDLLKPFGLRLNVMPIRIERSISPTRDVVALLRLYRLFRKYRFEAVHSVTPKAGLLTMMAAFLAGVPLRIHTFTGQIWATRTGVLRLLLKTADRLTALCATHVLVDSHSQRTFLIGEGVIGASKSRVIADGSICGVDTARFRPRPDSRELFRNRLRMSESGVLFLYLGRLTIDKGLLDFAHAFNQISAINEGSHILLVGPDEENLRTRILEICKGCKGRVHFEGLTNTPEEFMAAADVFCLPSYREGFGMAIIEAASAGVPAIGTKIYGVTDAVEEGTTGWLYPPGDTHMLMLQMLKMIKNPGERKIMGERARERVIRRFTQEKITSSFVDFYKLLLPPG
jgi:glycosyltransferase involved in cell wall biosynthesis